MSRSNFHLDVNEHKGSVSAWQQDRKDRAFLDEVVTECRSGDLKRFRAVIHPLGSVVAGEALGVDPAEFTEWYESTTRIVFVA